MSDLISRQEAIDDLHGKDPSQIWDTADIEVWINGTTIRRAVDTMFGKVARRRRKGTCIYKEYDFHASIQRSTGDF